MEQLKIYKKYNLLKDEMNIFIFLFFNSCTAYSHFAPLFPHRALDFKWIKYETGIQFLHTPTLVLPALGLVPIGFQMTATLPPSKIDNHVVLDIEYASFMQDSFSYIRMITTRRNQCTFVFYEDTISKPTFVTQAKVVPINKNQGFAIEKMSTIFIPEQIDMRKSFCLQECITIEKIAIKILINLPPTAPKDLRDENVIEYVNMVNSILIKETK